jgi:catechol 2,3-dioxygenase-like lactoylglutathione lyase family enzyme
MPNLTYISPSFIVGSLKSSVAFYVDKLGFKIRYIGPDGNPFWAIVGRDNISIFLKEIAPGIKRNPKSYPPRMGTLGCIYFCSRSGCIVRRISRTWCTFPSTSPDDDDGLRGFEVADTDGYILFFGRPNT